MKRDFGFESGFSQNFDSGADSERKTQDPAGDDSGTPDPWPPLRTVYVTITNSQRSKKRMFIAITSILRAHSSVEIFC